MKLEHICANGRGMGVSSSNCHIPYNLEKGSITIGKKESSAPNINTSI
jgi:hypothetical protein